MKTTKLVTGILNLVFTLVVLFQSCAAGFVNTVEGSGEVSGSAGVFVALFMIAGGIVMIATRKSQSAGGSWAGIILFTLAAIIGFALAGSFADLNIWAAWCAIMAVINLAAVILCGKNKKKQAPAEEGQPQ